ncbi:hypothetical protein SDC9_175394 [bioreactor metagenome]|uniref:Uncharacterized protein n=1 Tax=bioreactor metagenome TaxID=1076179 RepID=A0A645GP30_9ZZZZ
MLVQGAVFCRVGEVNSGTFSLPYASAAQVGGHAGSSVQLEHHIFLGSGAVGERSFGELIVHSCPCHERETPVGYRHQHLKITAQVCVLLRNGCHQFIVFIKREHGERRNATYER